MQKIDLFRGYYGIGIYEPKYEGNVGTLWRHAYLYNAHFIFTIGNHYIRDKFDTTDASKHIPLYNYENFVSMRDNLPAGVKIVAIELTDNCSLLHEYTHPLNAIYLLGSEGFGLPSYILEACDEVVRIYTPKAQSMNVATAGTLVMYDRIIKSL